MPACSITNLFHWHKYHKNSFIFSSVLSFIMLCITWLLFTGSCTNNSKDLSDANLNFIKTHPLMNEAVPTFFGSPVLIQTGRSFLYLSSSDQIQRAVLWSRVSPFWWRRLRLRLRPKKPCSATVVIWRLFVTKVEPEPKSQKVFTNIRSYQKVQSILFNFKFFIITLNKNKLIRRTVEFLNFLN